MIYSIIAEPPSFGVLQFSVTIVFSGVAFRLPGALGAVSTVGVIKPVIFK